MAKINESLDVVPAAGFILFRRNDDSNSIEFLLLQSKSGKYGTPKGHVEKFESDFDAAIRETKEETGLLLEKDFKVIPDFNCHVKYEVDNIRDGHKVKDIKLWLAEITNENLQITISSEHRGYRWAKFDEVILLLGKRPGFESYIFSFQICIEKINTVIE